MGIQFIDGRQGHVSLNIGGENKDQDVFIDRRKNVGIVLIILAGYKPYLYEDVFDRVTTFAPKNIDICIASSGLFDEQLNELATKNYWSYLSTTRNCVSLAQNIAIMLHPNAKFIYKMDEDIFITEHCFETLMRTYEHAMRGMYDVGFVGPLIPLNPHGYVRVLEKLNLIDVYERKFEPVKYIDTNFSLLQKSSETAKFFWGEGNFIPSIDKLNYRFQNEKFDYRPSFVHFNIACILLPRRTWEHMGGWHVPAEGTGMGMDEGQILSHCVIWSKGVIVSENTLVGHFSFGGQTEEMKEYYETHREHFSLHDVYRPTII